jgi:hypothetical protein
MSGGAIHMENARVDFFSNKIIKNIAVIGGGIRFI